MYSLGDMFYLLLGSDNNQNSTNRVEAVGAMHLNMFQSYTL